MVVRMKHTRGKRNRVRSHNALKPTPFSLCDNCGASKLPHVICKNCGWYGGRQVIDLFAKLDKKERKKKEKELYEDGKTAKSRRPLSAEELSHR